MVPGCLRIRAAQHIDVNQSVHAVPLPCPLAASAIINTGTPRPTPQVRANASYFDVVPSAEDVQSPLAEQWPRLLENRRRMCLDESIASML